MHDLNTQSAAAVIEAEVPQVSTPELAEPQVEASAVASTQQASNDDVVVETPAETVIEQHESQAGVSTAPKAFIPYESMNLVLNRRPNADNTFEYYVTNNKSDWLEKHGNFVSGNPIGIEESDRLIELLADETDEFLTVLDSNGGEVDLPDEGDQKNLMKLRDYVAQVGGTKALLMKGLRYIAFGSRLVARAKKSNNRVVSGLISIAYQVEGEKAISKYRLVGQMSRHLVLCLSAIGGDLVMDDVETAPPKPKAEPKQKPVKNKEEKGTEKTNNQNDANRARTAADPARGSNAHLLDTFAAGTRAVQRQMQELESQGDHLEGQLDHLIQLVEAIVVDNREIHKKLESTQSFNQALQREVREGRRVNSELLETNKSLTQTLVLILDKLNK